MHAIANTHTRRMLAVVWDLEHQGETVRNVEGLCRKTLNRNPRAAQIEACDYDDALAYLLGAVVELLPHYRPRDSGSRLGAYLAWKLGFLLSDYLDKRDGRHGEKRVVDTRYADAAARDHGLDDQDPGLHRPDQAAGGGDGDPRTDRALPRGWAELEGDRAALRPIGRLGVDPDREGAASATGRGGQVRSGDGSRAARADRGAAWRDCPGCGWRHYPEAPNGTPGWHYPDRCTCCGGQLT
ncbi:hypothetical protein Gocc_2895 [Gaiella occulta]|uniref:Uncharacterized protein n=1 Tax=Gaiella occulta TaxID=1002870 RepID=A0A7M2YTE1_9ACTN|nr:hypothetical protein Gocc_2895 [Gaiella occulta]